MLVDDYLSSFPGS